MRKFSGSVSRLGMKSTMIKKRVRVDKYPRASFTE